MDQIHPAVTPGFEAVMAAFNPQEMVKNWQARTVRVLRAQERMTQGMVAAARAEMRFSQEFFASRVGLLRWDPSEPGTVSEQAQRDMESLVSVMREVSEELRTGFTEAAQILRDEAQAAIRESVDQASAVTAKVQEAAQQAAHDAAAKTEAAIDQAHELAAQTHATAKSVSEEVAGAASDTAEKSLDATAEASRKMVRRTKAAGNEAA